MAGQIVYVRFFRRKPLRPAVNSNDEMFDLVAPDGKIIGRASRKEVHGNPELLHPTVHIQIFNKQGRLFLQKRSAKKDLFPGRWDTAVGGHVSSGESIHTALYREAMEELGVDATKAEPLFRYVMRNQYESELIHCFRMVNNGPFNLNKDEIDEGRFWTTFEIRTNLGKNIFTPNFEQEFAMLQKAGIV